MNTMSAPYPKLRADLQLIADMIGEDTRVLDVGCGDGALLEYLMLAKRVDARGVELSQTGVNACVARGLSVIQGDADKDLKDYPSDAFDYVILSQTIQATVNPKDVMEEMTRIGKNVIVSLPNFGHWRVRLQLAIAGRMPVTHALDEPWYSTPNIHLCSIKDFISLVHNIGAEVDRAIAVNSKGRARDFIGGDSIANLYAEEAVFLISSKV